MSEAKKTSNEELKHLSIDEILGDAEWQAAQKVYLDSKGLSIKKLKEKIKKEIVDSSIEMINYRTRQQNDSNFISYLVSYALLVLNYQKEDRSKIDILNKVDFLGLHIILHDPEADAISIMGSMSDEEVTKTFEYIFLSIEREEE